MASTVPNASLQSSIHLVLINVPYLDVQPCMACCNNAVMMVNPSNNLNNDISKMMVGMVHLLAVLYYISDDSI